MAYNEPNEKVIQAVKTILNELNGGNRHQIAMDIVGTVQRDHRTLQQSFWSALVVAQCHYAGANSDLRNDAAVELAKAVRDLAREKNWDHGLPYV